MNFLAHLQLAGADENLRMGAILGDFVRGQAALEAFTPDVQTGILLHRHIDSYTDALPQTAALRAWFPGDFRRYAGIIIDLGMDHELARNWGRWSKQTLEAFDGAVREMLDRRVTGVQTCALPICLRSCGVLWIMPIAGACLQPIATGPKSCTACVE